MTVTHMEIRDYFGEKSPLLGLSRTRDALTAYVENRWPVGRRKSVIREWGLTEDEARSVCTGRCSWATWDKIINHPNGRWSVILPVMGALFDQAVENHIIEKRKDHADHAARLGALVGDWWALGSDRRADDPDTGLPLDRRSRSFGDRDAQASDQRARGGGR